MNLDEIEQLKRRRIYSATECANLIDALKSTSDIRTKSAVVRALSNTSARPYALGPLIEEFKQAPQSENLGLKWIIGAALNKIADASVFEEMKDIVLDSSNGKSRELVVSALGNIKSPESQRLLLQLLSDEQLCGFAIMGLSKVADLGVRKSIIPFLSHPKTWIRKEAEKAIRRIDRSSNSETLS